MVVITQIGAEDTWEIRRRVMYPGKDLSHVQLPDDASGIHYGLFDGDCLVSVISLFVNGSIGQFRKFATDSHVQKQGYGTMLLQHLFAEASARHLSVVWCNARSSASQFYQKFGLQVVSLPFIKGGIEYVKMECKLSGA